MTLAEAIEAALEDPYSRGIQNKDMEAQERALVLWEESTPGFDEDPEHALVFWCLERQEPWGDFRLYARHITDDTWQVVEVSR